MTTLYAATGSALVRIEDGAVDELTDRARCVAIGPDGAAHAGGPARSPPATAGRGTRPSRPARPRRPAAALRGATTAVTRGIPWTPAATATTAGRSRSIPPILTAGGAPPAPGRSRPTAAATRR